MERIREQLRKMAFGEADDCIKLALRDYKNIAKLDLSLLSEIKTSEKGVEIKLLDRTKVLALLAEFAEKDGENAAASELLKALQQDDDDD